jgi:PAS domain S-box-containing protein
VSGESYKLLLIDDDEDDFFELRETLSEIKRSSFQLTWKSSYESGLAALATRSFDACILDYRLGPQTGLQLMREAREQGSSCPMILLTGHGDFELDLKAMEAGAADYLVKGQILPALLERSIRYSIKNARDMHQISEERENFQTLFNSTFEGILVHSQGKILDANSAACEILKCAPQTIAGKDISSFLRPDFREDFLRQLSAGRDLRMEAAALTATGSEIFLGLLSRTINLKGRSSSLIGIRDLTERKAMETQILQQDRLASLGLLASSLAHEIGTPLGVIRGRAEQVQKNADGKTGATMQVIVSQIDRIAKLVNSLLHIARSSNAGTTLDVSVQGVLNDVLALLSHEIERNEIGLQLTLKPDLIVRAEPGPLGQVFLNLLVNAIHALASVESGRARALEISSEENASEVRISISDTGIGIEEKDLGRLFQPFFTTKEVGEGTGLGLAVSYKIVTSWGGSIEVRSKRGSGSTFTVILRK